MTVKEELLLALEGLGSVKCASGVLCIEGEDRPIFMRVGGDFEEFLAHLDFVAPKFNDGNDPPIEIEDATVWLEDGSYMYYDKIGYNWYEFEGRFEWTNKWVRPQIPPIPQECQEKPTHFELSKHTVIRANKDLLAKSSNWNTPENIDVPKGTTLMVMDTANNGDVFVKLVDGVCILHSRAYGREGETREIRVNKSKSGGTDFILQQGHKSRHPYDWGTIDLEFWEVIPQECLPNS